MSKMFEKRIRVAIVGAGRIAESAHLPAYLRNPYAKIAAIVDTDIKRLARITKKFKVKNMAYCPSESVMTLNPLAFPLGFEESNDGAGPIYRSDGMSLLDWFAGQALPALIARQQDGESVDEVVSSAYTYAEMMLIRRKRFFEKGDGSCNTETL